MKAKLFLISAASGTGKSSLINAVLDNLNSRNFNVELSISHTTRKKRGGSQDYYIFTSEDDFKNKVKQWLSIDSDIDKLQNKIKELKKTKKNIEPDISLGMA